MVGMFNIGKKEFCCKKCGLGVCDTCSRNKRVLSKNGSEPFRVCDLCDTTMDNVKLRSSIDKQVLLLQEKIKM